ncbi:DNA mismatch repair protein MSH4 [Acorus calamus]|uniref:DNA mismatch repair protein MSH4 n=1 Tax=Acorus calamus TaxID=4465 RepID=A0AAV9CB91_ACOCL|nr:DNA mismatch repair protein MSH4 [Acorus calamus]
MEDDGGEVSSFFIEQFYAEIILGVPVKVGVAALDLRTASLHLSQYIETSCSYQNTKTLLHYYDPMVIIVSPNKLAPEGMVGVSALVDKHYSSIKKGAMMVKSLAVKEPSALGLDTYYKQYYLCLAAAAAAIKWTEAEKGIIVTSHSLTVIFNGSFDHMSIDATSVQNLEIIDSMCSGLWGAGNKKRSLFQMLKTTKSIGGARLLRANLLQPLKDIETINARLDCLDELMNNEELFFGLSQGLRKFPKETDRVLCQFCFKPKKVTDEVLKPINAKKSQMTIANIILLKTALDALPFLSKCFAVKAGIDGLLDVARRCFCDTSEGLMDTIREDISVLTMLAEVLCFLDMIVNSFAHTISTKPVDRYTRPELTESGPMAIDTGRHPVLECLTNEFVIGCYVPARFASLRIVDRIFTRIGTSDSVESNSSTFMTEMKETAFLMQNVTPRYTIFATHMERLSELASMYPNVKILHFHVEVKNNRLDFKFQLKDGHQHVPHYGLLLAGVAGLPNEVIDSARNITGRITQKEIKRVETNWEQYQSLQMTYRVAQRLICLRFSNQDEDDIRRALQDLKQSYIDGSLTA